MVLHVKQNFKYNRRSRLISYVGLYKPGYKYKVFKWFYQTVIKLSSPYSLRVSNNKNIFIWAKF